ncbi:MAG: class I SAM-dependent methyltransferase [Thermoanaerobaculia bacterium]
MSKISLRPCPICTQRQVEELHTQRFEIPANSPLPAVYDIVACAECGMVFAETPVAQDGYDRYYSQSSKYEDPAVATGGGASDWDRRRLTDLADLLESRVPKDSRVLDVGCAGGGLLAALHERGFRRLRGTDAAAVCVEQVTALGIAASCLALSNLSSLRHAGTFDLIVMSHVLEHVVDVRRLIEDAASLAAPHGLLYVETPDAEHYSDHAHVPFYFFDAEHINHFDTRHLSILGKTASLAPEGDGARTLQIAPGKTYPACYVWLRNAGPVEVGRHSPADRWLRTCVEEYVRHCQENESFPQLASIASSGASVVVWGAGSFAQRLFGNGDLADCNIVAIVDRDRNKQGRPFDRFTVEAPETGLRQHPGATVLVVAAIQEAEIVLEARRICGEEGRIVTLTSGRSTDRPVGRLTPTK